MATHFMVMAASCAPTLSHLCQGHKLPHSRGHWGNLRRWLLGSLPLLTPTHPQCPDGKRRFEEPRRGQMDNQGQKGS